MWCWARHDFPQDADGNLAVVVLMDLEGSVPFPWFMTAGTPTKGMFVYMRVTSHAGRNTGFDAGC